MEISTYDLAAWIAVDVHIQILHHSRHSIGDDLKIGIIGKIGSLDKDKNEWQTTTQSAQLWFQLYLHYIRSHVGANLGNGEQHNDEASHYANDGPCETETAQPIFSKQFQF